jgi:hypothetical protein
MLIEGRADAEEIHSEVIEDPVTYKEMSMDMNWRMICQKETHEQ